MTIQEIEQELFEMERKLKSMFNSCSQDLAIGIEKLRGELAELKESKKEGKWKPKDGEEYWFLDTNGDLMYAQFDSQNFNDKWRVQNLPIFKTHGKAHRYWVFMEHVKEKSYEFSKENFEDDSKKYYLYYSALSNDFEIDFNVSGKLFGTVYFKTQDDAQYIIDNFKDELMEYWI